jgi:hypothetical protein
MFRVLLVWYFPLRNDAAAYRLMVCHASGLVEQVSALPFFPVVFPHQRFRAASASRTGVVCPLYGGHEEAFVSVEDMAFPDRYIWLVVVVHKIIANSAST